VRRVRVTVIAVLEETDELTAGGDAGLRSGCRYTARSFPELTTTPGVIAVRPAVGSTSSTRTFRTGVRATRETSSTGTPVLAGVAGAVRFAAAPDCWLKLFTTTV
jgi:hypothetical protein